MGESNGGDATKIESLLERLRTGDHSAQAALIAQTCERVRHLARRMLRRYPTLARWEQTDDVLQGTLVRLHQTLQKVTPDSPRGFYALAATHVRRTLIDLARHHFGPEGQGAHHATHVQGTAAEGDQSPAHEQAAAPAEPASLEEWSEFHRRVEDLSEEEREVVHLLFYQGLTREEAADVLGVSARTVKRHWASARVQLHRALANPGAS
jgi:RNA polymerase sigma factor (TIGR02999 family)